MSKVSIILHAGLGNQLFMLFTGISKAIDENKDFNFYPVYQNPRGFYFTNLLKSIAFKMEDSLTNLQNRPGYEEQVFHYSPIPRDAQVIKGYFQSPKYFDHNKDKIIEILGLHKFIPKYELGYKAIAIHLRLGDKTIDQHVHTLLRPSYFINSINHLLDLIPNAENDYKFLIFAEKDDEPLVNDYLDEFREKVNKKIDFIKFYEIMPHLKDYEELLYMSSCHHFVIGNSSYSWFAAYLSRNENKQVCYPDEWFNQHVRKEKLIKDLVLDDWTNWHKK